jgi:Ca-activated chloride channel family protein
MIRRLFSPVAIGLALTVLTVATVTVVLFRDGPDRQAAGSSSGLRLLVTDDLADLDDLIATFSRESGVPVDVDHVHADDLVYSVSRPDFSGSYDAVWVAENDTGNLPDVVDHALEDGTTVASSPLVMGLRADAVSRLTDNGSDLDWKQLITPGSGQEFTFGMVEPSEGDDTSAALLTMASGLVDAPAAITPPEVYQAGPRLRALRERQTLTGTSYRDLSNRFVKDEDVDGIVSLESEILRINATRKPDQDPLTVIAPKGRAVFARYRIRPVAPTLKRIDTGDLSRLTDYLTAPKAQTWIAQHTFRRPVDENTLQAAAAFSEIDPTEVPEQSDLLDELSGIYLDTFHYPTRSVFVLDLSGSMQGSGMQELRKAFRSLDTTVATRHKTDAEILVVPFSTKPHTTEVVTVTADHPEKGLSEVADIVDDLQAGGGTAMYAALEQADDEIADRIEKADAQEQVTSIFLITDGANTDGPGFKDFKKYREKLEKSRCTERSIDQCRIPVYPVLVGDADQKEMKSLAGFTGGEVHDARRVDLGKVLRDLTAGR